MANDLTRGNVIIADTVGLLWKGWIKVRGFEYVPATAGQAVTLKQYKTVTPVTNTKKQITGTISGTNTLTSTGNLSNIYAAGDLLHIIKSTGDVANTKNGGLFLITTAGDNNAVVSADAQNVLTNEASKVYDIESFVGSVFYNILSAATEKGPEHRWFGDDGLMAENLALTAIGGGTLYIYL